MRQISRDSFARETLLNKRVYTQKTCDWCGQQKMTPKGHTYLYKYIVIPDSISNRDGEIPGLFCSVECMKAYHS